ncbi:MAG: cobalamin biosynthesis protein CobQ [Pseudomonadota bacterium]
MNTPAHLIFGAAALARKDQRGSVSAALGGAIAPDLSLYMLVFWHLAVIGTPAETVFEDLYYSPQWQAIFAVDNSVFVWLGLLAVAIYGRWIWLRIFSISALLHVALDFPLHAGDGRPHFWPLSDWVFTSPVSYWDDRYYGWIAGPAEVVVCALLTLVLFQRFRSTLHRALFIGIFIGELASSGVWLLFF